MPPPPRKSPGQVARPRPDEAVRSAPISPARGAAFAILSKVAGTAAHSDDLLHGAAVNALSPEDRNLTTALVLGVLRWQLQLDAVFRPMLQRPDTELAPAALIALRMGAFQLLHMDRIPPHAALNESVELARANGAPHAAGMVNAVLRRILRERAQLLSPRQTLVTRSAAETAHPGWLVARWRAQFGSTGTRAVCEYDQSEPPQAALFAPDEGLPSIDDGSRLVAEIAAAAVDSPTRVLDACAAPGGKTLVLAARHPSANIVAVDISGRRLASMSTRLQKAGNSAQITPVVADMTQPPTAPELHGGFDLVLCDAPCSGTGTLARNPEIRHRLRESDLSRQAERQRVILTNALSLLARGGRLVYSTCSLEREENEDVVAAVLQSTPSVRQVPIAALLSALPGLRPEAATLLDQDAIRGAGLRTLPGVIPCDGFFATVFERTE